MSEKMIVSVRFQNDCFAGAGDEKGTGEVFFFCVYVTKKHVAI